MAQKKAYMVIGCPGAGKTWICEQIKDKFTYVHHDLYIGMAGGTYVNAIKEAAKDATKPLLIEAPFSIAQIMDPLKAEGFEIEPVFIQEDPHVITERYQKRESKEIPKGHLTRQNTYLERAKAWGSFHGTSSQVLEHLKQMSVREEGRALMASPEFKDEFHPKHEEVRAQVDAVYSKIDQPSQPASEHTRSGIKSSESGEPIPERVQGGGGE